MSVSMGTNDLSYSSCESFPGRLCPGPCIRVYFCMVWHTRVYYFVVCYLMVDYGRSFVPMSLCPNAPFLYHRLSKLRKSPPRNLKIIFQQKCWSSISKKKQGVRLGAFALKGANNGIGHNDENDDNSFRPLASRLALANAASEMLFLIFWRPFFTHPNQHLTR